MPENSGRTSDISSCTLRTMRTIRSRSRGFFSRPAQHRRPRYSSKCRRFVAVGLGHRLREGDRTKLRVGGLLIEQGCDVVQAAADSAHPRRARSLASRLEGRARTEGGPAPRGSDPAPRSRAMQRTARYPAALEAATQHALAL